MPRKKDNVDLICDIAERAGLFEKSASLNDVLQTVVSIVAFHMKAAVCSVYLLDHGSQELVLQATQGLRSDAVGRVKLKVGEGITGQAVKELRPIYAGRGSKNASFKPVENIDEEQYEAILAVPILRGLRRIGALVVQDSVPYYFDDNDAKALRAIAAQLAPAIEDAQLLLHLGSGEEEQADQVEEQDQRLLRGMCAAKGVAMGQAVLVGSPFEDLLNEDLPNVSEADFRDALRRTEKQLEAIQRDMEEQYADIASLIFSAHLLILKDPSFSGDMLDLIGQGHEAPKAVLTVLNRYSELFSNSPNPRLREKTHDLKDLAHRLLQNLFQENKEASDYQGEIVLTNELLPSDIVKLAAQQAEGVILTGSGVASHVAILASSLGLPMVILDKASAETIRNGQELILDAAVGNVFVDPDEAIRERYLSLLQPVEERSLEIKETTCSEDGVRVELLANINLLSDLERAHAFKAEGVGLYRSEFPFIIRNDFPSEEEQYQIYRKLITSMQGRPMVFRTLDTGGDKMLSYFPQPKEDNPFLGLRAIRFSLRYKELFVPQLRAILRAGHDADLSIMFPLIASMDDFTAARDVVRECLNKLNEEDVPHCRNPRLGMMIELPSAVEIAPELAREGDFLCIGTNDLTQYMLAVDRTNEEVSELYREHHPSVLRAMQRVAAAALKEGTDVSLCGEVLRDESMLPFILGIGIRRLSANPELLPQLQQHIAHIDIGQAEAVAQDLLKLARIDEVEEYLQKKVVR